MYNAENKHVDIQALKTALIDFKLELSTDLTEQELKQEIGTHVEFLVEHKALEVNNTTDIYEAIYNIDDVRDLQLDIVTGDAEKPVVNRSQIATLLLNRSHLFGSATHSVYVSDFGAAAILTQTAHRFTPHTKVLNMSEFSEEDQQAIQDNDIDCFIESCTGSLEFCTEIVECDKAAAIEYHKEWAEYICIDVDKLVLKVDLLTKYAVQEDTASNGVH